jgi:FKBP-type peptidyl-prolyl cis-trans isomerase (trigger factor)
LQEVEIRGFRKGAKIPTQVVVAQVGTEAVKSKAIQDLSDRAIARVTTSGEVTLIGQSLLDGGEDAIIARFNPGAELQFEIKVPSGPTSHCHMRGR